MTKIDKDQLKKLILDGITSEELNSKYDYSKVTDMSFMFYWCSSLETIPLLETSKVTRMSCMFYECSSLKSIPLLDTSKVTDMSWMFDGCSNLRDFNPNNFPLYDFSELENDYLRENYPELCI